MPTEFQMPKLGLTMEEGTIVEWLVADGTEVTAGDPVLVIETDKTQTEVEAGAGGRLRQLAVVGETLPCGAVIGWLLAEGDEEPTGLPPAEARAERVPSPAPAGARNADAPSGPADGASGYIPVGTSAPTGRIVASPNARRVASELGIELARVRGTGPGGRITSEDVLDVAEDRAATAGTPAGVPTTGLSTPDHAGTGPVPAASVAARQLAELLGIDLREVTPDPAERRITRDGVAAHVRQRLSDATPGAAAGGAGVASLGGSAPLSQQPAEIIPLTGMRGTIAKRMYSSLRESAQLTLTMDADMDAVVADRRARQDAGEAPGYTDYVVAAAARALRRHPRVNSQVTDGGIAVLPGIHVGVAIALDDGLIVPVVRDADRRSVGEIGRETSRLAASARAAKLTPDEVQGGTFSVTALGMYGVDAFTPVINPPNAAILGVGRLREIVIVADGQVGTTSRLTLSLTWDHRVVDGAPAAEFTRTICQLLADPTTLL